MVESSFTKRSSAIVQWYATTMATISNDKPYNLPGENTCFENISSTSRYSFLPFPFQWTKSAVLAAVMRSPRHCRRHVWITRTTMQCTSWCRSRIPARSMFRILSMPALCWTSPLPWTVCLLWLSLTTWQRSVRIKKVDIELDKWVWERGFRQGRVDTSLETRS